MDSRRKPEPADVECFRDAAEEDFAVDLMIWAALLNRPKLAEIFWQHTRVRYEFRNGLVSWFSWFFWFCVSLSFNHFTYECGDVHVHERVNRKVNVL